jgi:hypothetical protein
MFSGQGAMVGEDIERGRSHELSPGGIPKGMVVVKDQLHATPW